MTAVLLLALGLASLGAPATEATLNAWTKMNAASVTTSSTGSTDSLTCDMEFASGSDTRIQVAVTQGGKTTKGTLLLVSGMLLTKDVPAPSGSELDMVDACGITLQLANGLLARGTAAPPMSIRGRREIDHVEEKLPLKMATTTAATEVPAPWSVRGWAESATAGTVSYDIVHAVPGNPESMHLVGTWELRMPAPTLPDATPLAGWKVFRLGTREGGEYGATPDAKSYASLGELRAAAKASPSAPPPSPKPSAAPR